MAPRVAIVSSEATPFAKTGGLADMVGALAASLTRQGVDASLVLPAYRSVLRREEVVPTGISFDVPVADGFERADVLEGVVGSGTPAFFVRADRFFDREGLYGPPGSEYPDNADRFAFFGRAVLELLERKGPPDVLHGHDWQAAFAVAVHKLQRERHPGLGTVRSMLTVHNVGYQGLFDGQAFSRLLVHSASYWPHFEFYGRISFLKAGLTLADRLTTVSPTYAREILTAEQGHGLDGVFRERAADLTGVLNGADYDVWDPSVDPYLPHRYSADDPAGKRACKADLLRRLELPNGGGPVLGMVARLVDQKGVDIVAGAAAALLDRELQLVVLGAGDRRYEELLREIAGRAPERVAVRIGFDDELAHVIEAGSDIFLMPSSYEPSGLNQLYSLRYGTIPIVRATGGLRDSVTAFDAATGEGTGFVFEDYSSKALVGAVDEALACYRQPEAWAALMRNAMRQDFSVDRAAARYADLYEELAPSGRA